MIDKTIKSNNLNRIFNKDKINKIKMFNQLILQIYKIQKRMNKISNH